MFVSGLVNDMIDIQERGFEEMTFVAAGAINPCVLVIARFIRFGVRLDLVPPELCGRISNGHTEVTSDPSQHWFVKATVSIQEN